MRGIQCILLATKGLISPNPEFVKAAFGSSFEEFLEIVSVPDRYIIYRDEYKNNGAEEWRNLYRALEPEKKQELLDLLEELNKNYRKRKQRLTEVGDKNIKNLLEHYYPNGEVPPHTPKEDSLRQQGLSVGYA